VTIEGKPVAIPFAWKEEMNPRGSSNNFPSTVPWCSIFNNLHKDRRECKRRKSLLSATISYCKFGEEDSVDYPRPVQRVLDSAGVLLPLLADGQERCWHPSPRKIRAQASVVTETSESAAWTDRGLDSH